MAEKDFKKRSKFSIRKKEKKKDSTAQKQCGRRERHKCPECQQTFGAKRLCNRHQRTRASPKEPDMCDDLCDNCSALLSKHTRDQHTRVQKLTCKSEECGELSHFPSPQLQDHRRNAADNCRALVEPSAATESDDSRSSTLILLLELSEDLRRKFVADRKKEECPHCDKRYSYRSTLTTHMRVHDEKTRIQCDKCPRMFATKREYEDHKMVHTDVKKYKCPYPHCDREYSYKSSRYTHMKIHSEETRVKCGQCKKVFATERYYERHLQTHAGERSYKCHICGDGFKQLTSLRTHESLHRGVRNRKCKECGEAFHVRSQLLKHRVESHGEVYFECPIQDCRKKFFDERSLKMHQERLLHSIKIE